MPPSLVPAPAAARSCCLCHPACPPTPALCMLHATFRLVPLPVAPAPISSHSYSFPVRMAPAPLSSYSHSFPVRATPVLFRSWRPTQVTPSTSSSSRFARCAAPSNCSHYAPLRMFLLWEQQGLSCWVVAVRGLVKGGSCGDPCREGGSGGVAAVVLVEGLAAPVRLKYILA